jgi:hypothetical protein
MNIAPASARADIGPSVGIFWKIDEALLLDRSPLSQAELYGDCLTHPEGHHERWGQWRHLGARQLRTLGYPAEIIATEYEEWPRGRVVYDKPKALFIIYADRRLHTHAFVGALVEALGLSDQNWRVMSDEHYA